MTPARAPARPVWLERADQVRQVWAVLPAALTGRLAGHEADRLAAEITRQLDHRTTAQLGERIARHWDHWRFKLAADLVRSPIAVAFRLVRRDFDCPDVRCEDRWHLDHDAPCRACDQIGIQITLDRQQPHSGYYSVPGPQGDVPTPPPVADVLTPAQDVAEDGPGRDAFRAELARLKARLTPPKIINEEGAGA